MICISDCGCKKPHPPGTPCGGGKANNTQTQNKEKLKVTTNKNGGSIKLDKGKKTTNLKVETKSKPPEPSKQNPPSCQPKKTNPPKPSTDKIPPCQMGKSDESKALAKKRKSCFDFWPFNKLPFKRGKQFNIDSIIQVSDTITIEFEEKNQNGKLSVTIHVLPINGY